MRGRPARAWWAARAGEQGGFALVELIVAMALMSLVAVAGYTSVDAFTKVSHDSDQRSQAVADARTGLEVVLRDLRAANPIDAVTTAVSVYDTAVSFSVYCSTPGVDGCSTRNLRTVLYRVTANRLERVANGTTRVLVGPEAETGLPVTLQRGAIVNGASEPVFTYYDATGTRLETQGASAVPSTKFRDCARSVQIRLIVRSVPNDPDATVELVSKVDLRNFYEVSQCA